MKFVCDREQLREALSVVNNVIPLKSTRPAIENVLVSVTDSAVELVGTDLEVAIRFRIDGGKDSKLEVVEPGTALVPARIAGDFVRDLAADTVTVQVTGERCSISGGTDKCELATLDADEFPVVERFPEQGALKLRGADFAKLVSRTHFAAAREPGRYAMHGILLQLEDGQLRVVATDGRRLAITSAPVEADGVGSARAIVPTKGMLLFSRAISDPVANIDLHFGPTQLGIRTARAEMFARLIEGEFPRYAAVIPTTVENTVESNAELFGRKLRLVANVTAGDTRAVRLSLSKGQMEILARSPTRGTASAQLEVDFRGKATDIAFNPDFVLDGLKNCEAELVRLEFKERTSPGKFMLGENYVYVVMPITVDA